MKTIGMITRKLNLSPFKRFRALSAGALLAVCATLSAHAQTVYSVNIVGCVPDMTIELLTAPLTITERQALHSMNFKQLAPAARGYYLHAVAYAVGFAVASDGNLPTSAMLAQHLQTVSSIYESPTIPAEYFQLAAAHQAVVRTAMQELNVRIADQIANNSSFQQAMQAGGVCSLYNVLISSFETLSDLSNH